MVLDPRRDEEERSAYELQYGYDCEKELEQYKAAVAMCIEAGFLNAAKFQQALDFVQK